MLNGNKKIKSKKAFEFKENIKEINNNLDSQVCGECSSEFKDCSKQSAWRACEYCENWYCQLCSDIVFSTLDSPCNQCSN